MLTRPVIENSKKIAKKFKKIRKHRHSLFSSQNRLVKAEKERKEKKLSRCIPTRPVIENSKKMQKKSKRLKTPL